MMPNQHCQRIKGKSITITS